MIGERHQRDRILDRHLLERQRDALIGLDVLVEHEIDARRLAQNLEHLLDRRVFEIDRQRLLQRLRQRWIDQWFGGLVEDQSQQAAGAHVEGLLDQYRAHLHRGRAHILGIEGELRVQQHLRQARVAIDLLQRHARLVVVWINGEDTSIELDAFSDVVVQRR